MENLSSTSVAVKMTVAPHPCCGVPHLQQHGSCVPGVQGRLCSILGDAVSGRHEGRGPILVSRLLPPHRPGLSSIRSIIVINEHLSHACNNCRKNSKPIDGLREHTVCSRTSPNQDQSMSMMNYFCSPNQIKIVTSADPLNIYAMSENWHSGLPIGIYDSKCIMHYNVKTHLCKLVSKVGWPIFYVSFPIRFSAKSSSKCH